MIYFVTAREVGRVKIGFSENPRARFGKICSDSPFPLALERVCEGDEVAESALHSLFAAHRVQGEWFRICPEIEAHMATMDEPAKRARSLNQIMTEALGCSNLAHGRETHAPTDLYTSVEKPPGAVSRPARRPRSYGQEQPVQGGARHSAI